MFALQGAVVRCPNFGELQIQRELICVDRNGQIVSVQPFTNDTTYEYKGYHVPVHNMLDGQFLFPGFIDIHVHAPQYKFTGTATDTPLMEWLTLYTFPCEESMQSPEVANDVYRKAVKRLLANGTTCAMYFASLHLQPTKVLAQVVRDCGQRAFIGKVCMDQNGTQSYVQSCETNLRETREFIEHVRALGDPLVHPVVTPRFIPTCTLPLLKGLGALAAEYDVHVQSHISESVDQVHFCNALHPTAQHDAEIYDQCGLLTKKTVMAHAVFMEDDGQNLFKDRGGAIAHCPLSNVYFAERLLRCAHLKSQDFPDTNVTRYGQLPGVKKLIRAGIKVGLATDVAGGYSPSMLTAMRNAVLNSRSIHISRVEAVVNVADVRLSVPPPPENEDILSFKEALWLGTVGSAQALGIDSEVGSLTVGQAFDALLVDCTRGDAFDAFDTDSPLDLVEKFINLGDDRHILKVWVQGKVVVDRLPSGPTAPP